VTSPPSNGVAKKLANSGKPGSVSGTAVIRRGDDHVTGSGRRGWSESGDAPLDHTHVTMFVKNSRVKFQLGHDDELHDVITRDVTDTV